MAIALERRKQVVSTHRRHTNDSGSPEVQVAMLTERITELSGHLQNNLKDNSGRRGLVLMVAKRNRLLKYLSNIDRERYVALITKLGLRK